MKFKVKNTDVKISFSFFALILIFVAVGKKDVLFTALLCALLHESVHIFTIILFGGSVKEIRLDITGGNIIRKDTLKNWQEAIIHYSAPVFNIVIGAFVLKFNWTDNAFATFSIITGVFNILPFYCFDGGNGLYFILINFLSDKICEKIVVFLSIVIAILSFLFFVFLIVIKCFNIYVVVMCLYLILSLFFFKNKGVFGL